MDIRIPNLGEGADSGAIVNIFVNVGDRVTKNQTLVELENEKAVAPIPSPIAGVVQKIYVKIGDKVTVGQLILSIDEEAGSAAAKASPSQMATAAESKKETEARAVSAAPKSAANPHKEGPVDSDYKYESKSGLPPPASPTVRKIAKDLDIDLTIIRGTEAGGRISIDDLKTYIAGLKAGAWQKQPHPIGGVVPKGAPSSEKIDFSKWGGILKKPVSSLRKKIAGKMLESWTTIPHVTQFDEADITALMAFRKKYSARYEKKGVHLTLTPLVMKAVVMALKKYPVVNSSLDEEASEIILKEYYHIGVAVDTEAGLIVPVVRDVDKKSIFEIAKDLETLAEKTRERKVSLDELRGGTFTISNLGNCGGSFFTPIINKPEVAILGVGRATLKPIFMKAKTKSVKDKIGNRLLLPLGLSYDHRVIDGADGARFIREIVANLENFKEADIQI